MRPSPRPLALLASLAALLPGCGSEAPPPPPAPKPAPIEAPPPAPPPPPTGRVLLIASEFGLSPLACFLDHTRTFATGDACLDLAPVGAEVWLMTGSAAKVVGRGAATCPGATSPGATITIEAPREALRGDAVLPSALKDALAYVPPEPPAEVDRAAPKELRERIARAIKAAFPDLGEVKPVIAQRARLDLFGDGTPEELVVATVPGKTRDEEANLRLSALFLVPEGGAPALLRARPDTRKRYTVIGSIDLDGDGTREIYLNTYGDDAFSLSLERREGDGLQSLGRWSCGG